MNQLLLNISENHVLRAALFLLANPVPNMEGPRTWAVLIEGHTFPTKALIRKSYCVAMGINAENIPPIFYTDGFTTQQAVATLEGLGFQCQRI